MSFVVLIPARMKSTRLPNKPLADLGGLPMVVRVAHAAKQSQATRVVIAAQDKAIVDAAAQHGVEAVLTDATHQSGTDRLAQAARLLKLSDDSIIVNVQGDEPFIEPELINQTAALLINNPHCLMGTAAHSITDKTDFLNPNVVKVVLDVNGHALYFSRSPIPYPRDTIELPTDKQSQANWGLRHVGIYAYRQHFLQQFSAWPGHPLEQIEALEQLRVLARGHKIAVYLTPSLPMPGIDTPEDLIRARARLVN
jgi:3-deoxy-manno-octulosonate cytidylyltransferase (CMP-KDO synthetase)